MGKGTCDLLAGAVQTVRYCCVYSFTTLNKILQDVSSIFILSEQDSAFTVPVVRRYLVDIYR
jgi:molybdate-binding protein